MDNQEVKSGKQHSDKKWDRQEWEENMGDLVDFEQRDKYSDAIADIEETITKTIEKISTAVKNTDTVKLFERVANKIMPKITEIQKLMEDLEIIRQELKGRNLEDLEIYGLLESEIEDIEFWRNFEIDTKKQIGKAVIDIGKDAVKGVADLGLNMIGASVIGVGKIIRGIKRIGKGNIYKITDEKSAQKIEEKREVIKTKKYEIIVEDEDDYKDKNEYEYDEVELEERDGLAKRTIRGIKEFYQEKSAKFTWVKDKESRQAFINDKKSKAESYIRSTDTYNNAVVFKENVDSIIDATTTKVTKFKDDVVNGIKDIPNKVATSYGKTKTKVIDAKDEIVKKVETTYEQAKDRFNKRKNDSLLGVLTVGGNFSKQLLKKIENSIDTKQQRLKAENEQIVQREETRKENKSKQLDTMEM